MMNNKGKITFGDFFTYEGQFHNSDFSGRGNIQGKHDNKSYYFKTKNGSIK